MGTILLSRPVAADHQWRQRLGPHRQLEYFVLQDPLRDTAPERLELVVIRVSLLVVLHPPRSPASSCASIRKSQALNFGAQCRGLCLVSTESVRIRSSTESFTCSDRSRRWPKVCSTAAAISAPSSCRRVAPPW